MTRQVIVAIGNAYRRDDGVGLAVAERVRGRLPSSVEIVECEQEPSRLIDAWDGASTAVVVDAVDSGSIPGSVHRFDAGSRPIPERLFRSSTHAFGLGETIELARALGKLPERVIVYGVEGAIFDAGEGLSAEVAAAVEETASAVLADVVDGGSEGMHA
jgi:hydrogenase maturation protease